MLKKLLSVFMLAALIFTVVRIASPFNQNPRSDRAAKARQSAVVAKRLAGVVPKKENAYLQQNHRMLTGDETVTQQNFLVLSKAAALTGPGTLIGRTAYNYQTNDNLHDRIIWNPANNTIHAEWMYGNIAEAPGFAGRRMKYNYFNGASWAFMTPGNEGVPIETERTGFGSLSIDANNVAVPVSHYADTGNDGTAAAVDFTAGYGFFTTRNVYRRNNNPQIPLEPAWPDIAVDRKGSYHVVARNSQLDPNVVVLYGVDGNILYWKSTDQGETWSDYLAFFLNTNDYPLSADVTNGVQIAASDTDNGKIGVLVGSFFHTFYFFESDDNGETWKPGINITGKARLRDPETLDLIPQQFDIYVVDSTGFGGDIDTAFAEWGNIIDNGPADIRPPGPADLMYINGEPHVVWNEKLAASPSADGSVTLWPRGMGYFFTNPMARLLKGGTEHIELGICIKHWSPSTGVSIIAKENRPVNAWPGDRDSWLNSPQIGIDPDGNLYCVYIRYDDTDTLRVNGQTEQRFGPLSFGEIWGAKSTDNGTTWFESVRLSNTRGEDERFVGISDLNPSGSLHLIYQTANIPGTAVGTSSTRDHPIWVDAEIRHWAVPTSMFSSTPHTEPEIDLSDGVLTFYNTPGTTTRSFKVFNRGTADLVVDDVFTTDSQFLASPRRFTVAPGASQEVSITYKAKVATSDTFLVLVGIPNNDPSEHSRGLAILATALTTAVASRETGSIPGQYALAQNYPNPISLGGASKLAASATTEIHYALKANGHAKIRIFDMLGREVAVLVDGIKQAGEHGVKWQPSGLTAGIYFYSLEVNGFRETRKMVLLP